MPFNVGVESVYDIDAFANELIKALWSLAVALFSIVKLNCI